MRHWIGVLGLLALAGAAPSLPGVGVTDDRVTVDAAVAPWRSLERLQIPGENRCTAVLIGPRTALTAAHCLWAWRTHRFVAAGGFSLRGPAALQRKNDFTDFDLLSPADLDLAHYTADGRRNFDYCFVGFEFHNGLAF